MKPLFPFISQNFCIIKLQYCDGATQGNLASQRTVKWHGVIDYKSHLLMCMCLSWVVIGNLLAP